MIVSEKADEEFRLNQFYSPFCVSGYLTPLQRKKLREMRSVPLSRDIQEQLETSKRKIPESKEKKKMKRKILSDVNESELTKKVKDEDFKYDGLSEYEKMVYKNKAEKLAFLESLKIDEVKEGLSEAIQSLKPKKPPRKLNIKSPKSQLTAHAPPRRSLRLANVDIDLSEDAVVARAVAAAKLEATVAAEKELPPVLPFEQAMTPGKVYKEFESDFDSLDFKTMESFDDYVSHFKNMKLTESRIAKVVNGRITSMAIHPMQEKIIVSVGNKYGSLGFWHVNSDSNPYEFRPHLQGITNMKFNPDFPNMIISSSYDGTMRCGDMEKKIFNEIYNISDEASCTYFDFLSSTTFLVSQNNGKVSVVDNRSNSKTSEKSHKCHEFSVKTVSVHPTDKSYFISADRKGRISLWDLRKLHKQPVIEVHHHQRVVSSAFFSPVTGKNILTTSADDSICLFDSSKLGKAITLKKSMKHNNWTGRWLTTFKATWLPNADDAFVVGSMLSPRRIEIFNDSMNNIFNFRDEYFGCITSVNQFHPHLPVLAGANSSGKVYVFAEV